MDERVDSICTSCFQTIGYAEDESGLAQQEYAHIQQCQGFDIANLMHPENANEKRGMDPDPSD
jgi:hypothetical protein